MSEQTTPSVEPEPAADEIKIRFKNKKRPQEKGTIVLNDKGQVEVRPSDEFLAELARLEEQSLKVSRKVGSRIGLGLLVLGGLFVAASWLAGRIGGTLRNRVTRPRYPEEVTIYGDVTGGLHLILRGDLGETIELNWGSGEISPREVGEFLKALRPLRKESEKKPAPSANGTSSTS